MMRDNVGGLICRMFRFLGLHFLLTLHVHLRSRPDRIRCQHQLVMPGFKVPQCYKQQYLLLARQTQALSHIIIGLQA